MTGIVIEDRPRGQQAPRLVERVDERRHADRQRERVLAGQERPREEELVPGRDEREERGHRKARDRQRDDDPPERPEDAEPVDPAGFLELVRDRVEEALEHQDAERDGERRIGQDQRPRRVDEPEVGEDPEQRDQQDDAREHLGDEEDVHRRAPPAEAEPRDGIGAGRREEDREDRRHDRHEQRVERPVDEVAAGQQSPVVLERRVVDELDLGRKDLALRLEAGQHGPDDRRRATRSRR